MALNRKRKLEDKERAQKLILDSDSDI